MSRTIGPVAVIDLGTNTFNLLIIEQKNSVPKLLVSTKEGVALGRGGINTNQIASDAWQRGIECLQRFKEICVDYNCLKIKGIATSAIRNARNGSEFIREVESHGGSVDKIMMSVRKLQTILDEHGITEVDYCSIDTEGSELKIIKSIDFSRTNVKIFSIENNYGNSDVYHYLISNGYTHHTKLHWEDIYVKNNVLLNN
jgi:hypothetical protein